MATVKGTLAPSPNSNDGSLVIAQWTAVLNAGDGTPAELGDFADKSVQVTGTFGVGGSISLEGSNDGTNYVILTKPGGTAATLTAAGLIAIVESTRFVKPVVTAGDGTTSLNVTLLARRSTPLHQ